MGRYSAIRKSHFKRRKNDFYQTPLEAIEPLTNYLQKDVRYIEPCAGDGALVNGLNYLEYGTCIEAYDIDPKVYWIKKQDALKLTENDLFNKDVDMFITNPPWSRELLHPLIEHLSSLRPTWLLFDADWMHTKQSSDLIKRCLKIVSIGRVKWIADSKYSSLENCCWYLFDKKIVSYTVFIGR